MSREYDVTIKGRLTIPANQAGGQAYDREDMPELVRHFLNDALQSPAIPSGVGIEVGTIVITNVPPTDEQKALAEARANMTDQSYDEALRDVMAMMASGLIHHPEHGWVLDDGVQSGLNEVVDLAAERRRRDPTCQAGPVFPIDDGGA